MYDIVRIDLEDFGVFRGKHSFEFPAEPGLYGVTGKNLDNPRLGANGIGKSTFFLEAVYWCNYGRTTRGLRANDIINYDAKSCSVTVEQIIGNETVTVTRTQSPNSLRLNGVAVDQQTLEKHLRRGPEAFTYSTSFPQFGEAFFDRSPADKLTLFAEIMGLDYWLERSKTASDLGTELEAERHKLEQALARTKGAFDSIKDDITGLIPKRDVFEAEKTAALKRLNEGLKKINSDIEYTNSRIATTIIALQGLEKRLLKAEKIFATVNEAKLALKAIEDSIRHLNGLEATCPTCLQRVDEKHLMSEKARLEKKEQLILAELESLGSEEQDVKAIQKNLRDFEDEKRDLQGSLKRFADLEKRASQDIETEKNRPNPYTSMIQAKKAQRAKLKDEIDHTEELIRQIEQDHVAVSYWVGGFKRIRLFIIEQALQQLELEINNALSSLGLIDWTIKLDVERENKSGGVTKGFTVLIYPPGSTEPKRLESYSGGETQRLWLAGNLGLANLIMEQTGLQNTIEFFDEPSTHLSDEGILDLADTLMQRAIDTERRIFIIEHRLPDYPYTGTIKVTKTPEGSHIDGHTG